MCSRLLLAGIQVLVLLVTSASASPQPFVLERVSISSQGIEGDNFSSNMAVSANGRFVAFDSMASNLVAGDTNGKQDVFVHDRLLGLTERVSIAVDGSEGNDLSQHPEVSADGRYICFVSMASNLVLNDTNSAVDVFVYDRNSRSIERVSVANDGSQFPGGSNQCAISADGSFAVFPTSVSGASSKDIYLRDRQNKTTEQMNLASGGTIANDYSTNPGISADGRYVLFDSLATNLVNGDTNSAYDVFLRDRQTSTTERVSLANGGGQANANSNYGQITADGRYVVFSSAAANLVSGDTNGWQDVFLFDRQTKATERISVSSSGLEGNYWSRTAHISADGSRVTFDSSANNLVSAGVNASEVYLRDRSLSQTAAISITDTGASGNNESFQSTLGANGYHVVFMSRASNLVPDDTNGTDDIFIYASLPEGDVDGVNGVSAYDAALAAKYTLGTILFTSEQILAADLSKSGGVTAYDAALIARRSVGL